MSVDGHDGAGAGSTEEHGHEQADDALQGYADAAQCHLGDFMEYAQLRRELSDVEASGVKQRKAARRQEAVASMAELKVGDVVVVPAGKFSGLAVVLDPGLAGAADGAT